jgi:hypothetical protein
MISRSCINDEHQTFFQTDDATVQESCDNEAADAIASATHS